MAQVWVKVIGSGTEDDKFRPDLPPGTTFSAEIPCELDPASPKRGKPAVTFCRCFVDKRTAKRLTNAAAEKDVPLHDRMLIRLCRCKITSGYVTERDADKMEAVIGELDGTQNGKRLAAELLRHAVLRGLRLPRAQKIAQRKRLLDVIGKRT